MTDEEAKAGDEHFEAWAAGAEACEKGEPRGANPFPENTAAHVSWRNGWHAWAMERRAILPKPKDPKEHRG